MDLIRARVSNYKCVLDSDWFRLEPLTCLVGKNESGKTAVLEALEKLSSARPERADFSSTDFPRVLGEPSGETAIEAVFALSDHEYESLADIAGTEDAITSREVTVSKGYDNTLEWSLPLDHAACVRVLVDDSGLADDESEALAGCNTASALIKALSEVAEPSARQTAFLTELVERFPAKSLTGTVTRYLEQHLPLFVYYSNYDRLPGRVSINQLQTHVKNNTVESLTGGPVFLSLLSMVGLSLDDLVSATSWEPLVAKLESVAARTSRQIFKYWSQNKNLKVRFMPHAGYPGDDAPFNTGNVFETRIENTRHDATIILDERSTGFVWFFSFLVWFSEVQKQHGDNLVVLLDEPGLTLHAKAQHDLLRYIREELLPKYQVIYTTHSPFMVDPANVGSARTVQDVDGDDETILGTKVGDRALSADGDTLFPLRAALGYDISQTLFVGEHTLLVEGPSDLLYLQWASSELGGEGRTRLDPRWTVTPCGGISKIQSFLALFGGNKLHVAVLTDHGHGDKAKVRDLRASQLLRDGHVFTADEYSEDPTVGEGDTEDILGASAYATVVNAAYKLQVKKRVKVTSKDRPTRIVPAVEEHFRTLPADVDEYDHYAPAAHLIKHPDVLTGRERSQALDRFEALFTALNALL
ncbi:ATP-dependent nuclease [Kocuria sp.]|uniref:ATP-dependent nuclease n=1 Tax=Kocuria sp. TaxID=1871328 RepID=UPI0026E01B60|nr:AAA family ATPase [Kocuria sp.]MDO5619647.1 AAA family ATPase [Kocuria sp.]